MAILITRAENEQFFCLVCCRNYHVIFGLLEECKSEFWFIGGMYEYT
jgi:hypothetical protein